MLQEIYYNGSAIEYQQAMVGLFLFIDHYCLKLSWHIITCHIPAPNKRVCDIFGKGMEYENFWKTIDELANNIRRLCLGFAAGITLISELYEWN